MRHNANKNPIKHQNFTEEDANINEKVKTTEAFFTLEDANFRKRVREISLKSSSLTGIINSSSVNKQIQFESSLERDFIYFLEFDKEVKFYLEQPLEIFYEDSEGRKRKYTPDFLIEYFDSTIEVIEIKYESTLSSQLTNLQPKFNAAIEFCELKGFKFKVITDDYIRKEKSIELLNYKFLHRYKNYFDKIDKDRSAFIPCNFDVGILYSKLQVIGKCSINELVSQCSKDLDKKAELIFLTWYLISNNFFKVDVSEKLNLNSLVWQS